VGVPGARYVGTVTGWGATGVGEWAVSRVPADMAIVYPAPIPPPRGNGVTMGMVAGTTLAMLFVGKAQENQPDQGVCP